MKNSPFTRFIQIAALISIFSGIIVITGWYTDIEIMKSFFTGLATMKFNTAICFILFGTTLYLNTNKENKNKYLQILLLLMVLLIAGITLSQNIFNYNSGLDELFINEIAAGNKLNGFPGRMSNITATGLIGMCTALLLIIYGKRKANLAAQYIFHFVTVIAFIAAIGYLYKIPGFYKLSFLTSIALNTSLLILILSIAGSMINYKIGITGLFTGKKIGSIVARRLFPIIILAVLALGYLRFILQQYYFMDVDYGIALYTLSFILVQLLFITLTAKQLNKTDAKRSEAEQQLLTMNLNLLQLVDERTEQIQKISERLTLATKGSKIGIWDWDIITDSLTWDDRMYELYGITPLTFGGAYKAWENGLHPDDKESGRKAIVEALAGKQEFDIEFRVLWPDESVHYIKGIALVQRDNSGKAIRMIGTNWDTTERVLLQKKLEQAREQNEKIVLKTAIVSQEKERTHIGHELHENVNQLLASANIYMGLAMKDCSQKTAGLIVESRQMIIKAIEEIHNLVHNIRHSHIEDIGLYEAIKDFIRKINVTKLVKVVFKPTLNPSAIPPEIALTVYRILQEQLNNILKYSEAKHVNIQLDHLGDDLILVIADDGKGANMVDFKKGMGLLNMKNRAKAYDGNVSYETSPGKGFKLTIVLPLQNVHSS